MLTRRTRSVMLAIVVVSSLFALFTGIYLTSTTTQTGSSWGPVQTGTVRDIGSNGWITLLENAQPNTILPLQVSTGCHYQPGDVVQYQISTFNYTLSRDGVRLVNAAQGCYAL